MSKRFHTNTSSSSLRHKRSKKKSEIMQNFQNAVELYSQQQSIIPQLIPRNDTVNEISNNDLSSSDNLNVITNIESHRSSSEDEFLLVPNLNCNNEITDADVHSFEFELNKLRSRFKINNDMDVNNLVNDFMRKWAVDYDITRTALNPLLKFFNNFFPNIFCNYKSLLKTPRTRNEFVVLPGRYVHVGILSNLNNILKNVTPEHVEKILTDGLTADFNIDGSPIHKTGKEKSFWIISGRIFNLKSRVFVIGVYLGPKKPNNFSEFLEPFIDELFELTLNGFSFRSNIVKLNIRAFINDAPARADTCGMKYYNSSNGCPNCFIIGFFDTRMSFFPCDFHTVTKRTDFNFRLLQLDDFRNADSPLLRLNIDMIRQNPKDVLHVVYLGVVKTLMNVWFIKKKEKLFSTSIRDQISKEMLSNKEHQPVEFSRRIESLAYLPSFKGTQYRNILLFLGPVCFLGKIPQQHYNHFLELHVAITILNCPDLCVINNKVAEKILHHFIEEYAIIYGQNSIVHNVHMLGHISEDVMYFKNCLESFSSFPFESALGQLKKLVHTNSNPLEQLTNRIQEVNKASNLESTRPGILKTKRIELKAANLQKPGYYNEIILNGFKLNVSESNRYVLTESKQIIQIDEFCKENSNVFLYGKQLDRKTDLYKEPILSSKLDIYKKVSDFNIDVKVNVKDLNCKMFKICNSEQNITCFFPMSKFINDPHFLSFY